MKNKIALGLMALGLALPVANLKAQDGPPPPRPLGPPREERDRPRPDRDGPRELRDDRERGERGERHRRFEALEDRAMDRPGVRLFRALDRNHDGVIDRREFARAVRIFALLNDDDAPGPRVERERAPRPLRESADAPRKEGRPEGRLERPDRDDQEARGPRARRDPEQSRDDVRPLHRPDRDRQGPPADERPRPDHRERAADSGAE